MSSAFHQRKTGRLSITLVCLRYIQQHNSRSVVPSHQRAHMQVAGRWKSSQMPAHYAKAELAERVAIARFKDGKG